MHASFWHEDRQKEDISKEVTAETKNITGIMKKTALYYALLGLDDQALAIGKKARQLHKQQLSIQRVDVKNIANREKRLKGYKLTLQI